ncbi:major capsid protein [uncultured Desulfobacter sp.]|uniref:major capsid protein n=1 Tax=uncultured Desulfobacter sp. TaxID=240139 RepID=UPI002AABC965|nr:major capsid protein [uncultured Desulfobacter sp.]
MLDLRKYFNVKAVAQRLKQLQPLKTTVVDTFFTRKVNHPFDKVGRSDLSSILATMPLINRGAASLAVKRGSLSLDDYEPFEVATHDFFTAADMNRLKHLDEQGVQARLSTVDDNLRRICRATAEGIAAKSLTGTVSWPVALEGGGTDTYQVSFGSPLSYTPDVLWDASGATVRKVFNHLQEMETLVEDSGYGGVVKYWAGKDAYNQLLALTEVYGENPKAKLRVEVSADGISLGGFLIKKMAESYLDPITGTSTAKVGAKQIMAYASDAVHTLFYCALDDLDANLQPMPYYSKPVKSQDPSGVKIIGRSKPFPAPVVKAICWATVVS